MLTVDNICLDCPDPRTLAGFWTAALGWGVAYDSPDEVTLEPGPDDPQADRFPAFILLRVPEPKTVKNRMHLCLRPDDQDAEVTRLEGLGATRVDIGQEGGDGVTWVVMADPDGNEFCVLSDQRPESS